MPADKLNITLIQPDIVWEDKDANLRQYEQYIANIKEKREVVLLPEMFSTGFSMDPERLAEDMSGPSVQWMKDCAARYRCIIASSLIIEEDDNYYNRLIWMQPDGNFGYYDKRHLFAFAGEDQHYDRGEKRLIASVKGWRINLLVCYDLRFPVWARNSLPLTPSEGGGTPSLPKFYEDADPINYGLLKEFMLEHRKNPTKAEQLLWEGLRGRQLEGYKFRRQHIIGNFIADFVCLSKGLVIEVDGLHHQLPENSLTDNERTEWLNNQGYHVLRVSNNDVINNFLETLDKIGSKLRNLPDAEHKHSGHSPSFGGGWGEASPAYDVLIYVANWPQKRSLAWNTLLQARAIENQTYVVGVNRVGTDGKGIVYSGESKVFGPLGETLWPGSNEATSYTITLDKEMLDGARKDFPFLRDADKFLLL